ncbi:MAG: XdhC family protein, partial [Salinarimonas sp.]
GAWLAIRPDGAFAGTIGGGRLEWDVLTDCRKALEAGRGPAHFLDYALGPDLGQCCGGRVLVSIETFDGRDAEDLRALAGMEGRFEVTCRVDEGGRVVRG